MADHMLIKGDLFEDGRGKLRFVNAFDLQEVVRFYEIAPKDVDVIRAWQAHRKEKKWFYCLSGSFVINLVQVDNFDSPSDNLVPKRIEIDGSIPQVLCVPEGYATGIKATSEDSRLQVFSNFGLEESKMDDFRYPPEKWDAKW
ncbi:MAG: dTDP-6-deoxy-3,4-keto-hexulose isomerase [Allomuricauda sp.]